MNVDPGPLAPLRAGVLVGGESRRMGRAKALLPLAGSTILEHIVAVLESFAPASIVGQPPFPLPPRLLAQPRVSDRRGLGGPLAGILGALDQEPAAAWLLVACDQPLVSTAAIAWLLGERRSDAWAIVPSLDGRRLEPLLAVWEPAARPRLEALMGDERPGKTPSLQGLLDLPGLLVPCPPRELASAWENVNSPADWSRLSR